MEKLTANDWLLSDLYEERDLAKEHLEMKKRLLRKMQLEVDAIFDHLNGILKRIRELEASNG